MLAPNCSQHRRTAAVAAGLLALTPLLLPLASEAQQNLRNSFPGRRLGGGTRGECSARLLANLVPSNSVFAPGKDATIGLLEGPTAQPRPLQLSFRPASGNADTTPTTRDLPASPVGLVLLRVPAVTQPTIWESGYRCDQSATAGSGTDGLSFVETASPPAVSLLLKDQQSDDRSVAAALQQLRSQCGKTVSTQTVAKTFGLSDAITPEWPQQLPVRCP